MTNLNSLLKSRDITLPTKICLFKAMVFPVVMYECESWTIKKSECQRIDAFELWCWRRLLRVPWTAQRSNQLILKEISPEYSLEGLMLRLKLQWFGYLMWPKNWLTGKDPGAGKDWRHEKGMTEDEVVGWHHWLDGHKFEQASAAGDGKPGMLQSTGSQRVGHDWVTKLKWTESRVGLGPPWQDSSWKTSLLRESQNHYI